MLLANQQADIHCKLFLLFLSSFKCQNNLDFKIVVFADIIEQFFSKLFKIVSWLTQQSAWAQIGEYKRIELT